MEDDADELLHHLGHLFLAGDQGEGRPQVSSSSSPKPLRMNSTRSTPMPLYSNKWPFTRALHVAGEPPSLFPFLLVPSFKIPIPTMASHH